MTTLKERLSQQERRFILAGLTIGICLLLGHASFQVVAVHAKARGEQQALEVAADPDDYPGVYVLSKVDLGLDVPVQRLQGDEGDYLYRYYCLRRFTQQNDKIALWRADDLPSGRLFPLVVSDEIRVEPVEPNVSGEPRDPCTAPQT